MTLRMMLAVMLLSATIALKPAAADPPKRIEVRWAEMKPIDKVTERDGVELSCTEGKAYLHSVPILTKGDIAGARLDRTGDFALVLVDLKAEASKRIEASSAGNLDKPLVVLVDGKVVAAMVVKSKLSTLLPLGPMELKAAMRVVQHF